MKNIQIIALVAGASVVTFIASVVFSINMVSISPKNLAKVIKGDPETFISAIKDASEGYKKEMEKKAQEKEQEEMERQFKNPAQIQTKGRVTFGDKSAPVTIVEFSDFQCPYCQRAANNMRQLKSKYKGQVKIVYKHLPLSFHPFAKPAAEYFEAVALVSHSKAKKFHDEIFDNFDDYARLQDTKDINTKLAKLVKTIGLELGQVKKKHG